MSNVLTYTHEEMKIMLDKFLELSEYHYCEAEIDDTGSFTVKCKSYRNEGYNSFISTFGEFSYEDKIYTSIFGIFARVERSRDYKILFVRFD